MMNVVTSTPAHQLVRGRRDKAYNDPMKSRVFISSGGTKAWLVLWTVLLAIAAFAAAGVWGLTKVLEWVLPRAGQLAVLGAGVFVVGIVPLSLVREWRIGLARLSLVIASVYGLGVWVVSFMALWKWVGFFALPVLFWAAIAAPLAIVGYLVKSDWNPAIGIAVGIVITQLIRAYGVWLAARARGSEPASREAARGGPVRGETTVIDVEVVETQENGPAGEPRRISNNGELK